jgi:hypothetical protein
MRRTVPFLVFFLFGSIVTAQQPRPVVSPKVGDDGKVTFSLRAPRAEKVTLNSGNCAGAQERCQRTHPAARRVRRGTAGPRGFVEVPGLKPRHDEGATPHGNVTIHWYTEGRGTRASTSTRRRARMRRASTPSCISSTAVATTTRTGCTSGGQT